MNEIMNTPMTFSNMEISH